MTLKYTKLTKKFLNNYAKITDINDVDIYTKIRYITIKIDSSNRKQYTISKGGYLVNIDKLRKFMTLSSDIFYYNSFVWRIKIDRNHVFYRKMTRDEQLYKFLMNVGNRQKQQLRIKHH